MRALSAIAYILSRLATLLLMASVVANVSGANAETLRELEHKGDNLYKVDAYSDALRVYREALDLLKAENSLESCDGFRVVKKLANLHRDLFQYSDALFRYLQALKITEGSCQGSNIGLADINVAIGSLYFTIGENHQAITFYEKALKIQEEKLGVTHPHVTRTIERLAVLLLDVGQYGRAIRLQKRALATSEDTFGPEDVETAFRLVTLATTYYALGKYDQAAPLLERALTVLDNANYPDNVNKAILLTKLIDTYSNIQIKTKNITGLADRLASVIANEEISKNDPRIAGVLGFIARYSAPDKAQQLFEVALNITENNLGTDHATTAIRKRDLAGSYERNGLLDKAVPLYQQAFRITTAAGAPPTTLGVTNSLTHFYYRRNQPELAIFFGKLAVNIMQGLRSNSLDLDRTLQKSLLEDNSVIYSDLANWLIAAGRMQEAREVLRALKEEEYFDFIGKGSAQEAPRTRITFSIAESPWLGRLEVLSAESAKLGAESRELALAAKLGLTPKQQLRQQEVKAGLAALEPRFEAFFHDIANALPQDAQRLADKEKVAQEAALARTRLEISRSGPDAARVDYLLSGDQLHILLTTVLGTKVKTQTIVGKEVQRQLLEFRRAVKYTDTGGKPGFDPRPLGQTLFSLLITPIEKDLVTQGIKTLMLSLEGSLRYIPFGALYDGKTYLTEKYALALVTDAARDKTQVERMAWKVVALGTSEAHEGFKPLPGVKRELAAIVGPQGLSGESYLDRQFTAIQLQTSLQRSYPVLHIASHFQFTPGTEEDSFLLLGDGHHLSLKEIREGDFQFSVLDILTLSACETAMQGGALANGREVEGFGTLAQNKGARTVLATLWKLSDASAPELMRNFYAGREHLQLTKAEALRRAQMALIHGGQVGRVELSPRSPTLIDAELPNAPKWQTDLQSPYGHPYFWAPFVLMGEWQ